MAGITSTQDVPLSSSKKNQMETCEDTETAGSLSAPEASLVARVELTEEDVSSPGRLDDYDYGSDVT